MTTQYIQADWTGEQGINPDVVLCANPSCSKPLRNCSSVRSSGRPSDYCSNACKMKVYRQRFNEKALRNAHHKELLRFEQFSKATCPFLYECYVTQGRYSIMGTNEFSVFFAPTGSVGLRISGKFLNFDDALLFAQSHFSASGFCLGAIQYKTQSAAGGDND